MCAFESLAISVSRLLEFLLPGKSIFFRQKYPGTRVVGSDQILLVRAQFSVAVPTSCKASYLTHFESVYFERKGNTKKNLIKI